MQNKTIAWVVGPRNWRTVRKLYNKIAHLNPTIYTDNWRGFNRVFPKNKHVIGKSETIYIEQNNSDTRHYLARMTRKSKVVSKSTYMLDMSLRLMEYFRDPDNFSTYQLKALSIYG